MGCDSSPGTSLAARRMTHQPTPVGPTRAPPESFRERALWPGDCLNRLGGGGFRNLPLAAASLQPGPPWDRVPRSVPTPLQSWEGSVFHATTRRRSPSSAVGRPGQGRRRRGPGSRPSELGVSLLNKGSHSWLASAVVLATPERVPALSGDPSPHLSSTETPAAASSAPQSPRLLSGKMGCGADLPDPRVTVGWAEVLYETGLCLGRQRHQPVFQGAGSKEQDADSGHL